MNNDKFSEGKIFPHLTAIIDVKKGVVQGISWDDACIFCGYSRCLANSYDFNGNLVERSSGGTSESHGCYYTVEQCQALQKAGDNICDLTLYVVWTGTDVDGNVMSSSNSRFSAFQPRSIQKMVQDTISSVGDSVNDAKDSVNDAIDDAKDSVTDTIDDAKNSVTDTVDNLNPLSGNEEQEGKEEGAN